MAVTQAVPLGMAVTLAANVVYALPSVKCTLFTDTAGAAFSTSNSLAFTNSVAGVFTNGSAPVGGLFIKFAADTVVVCKKD
jgi:hypothetical protein